MVVRLNITSFQFNNGRVATKKDTNKGVFILQPYGLF